MKVNENQRDIISQKNANTLNRLNNPEDIMVQREAEEAQTKVAQVAVARAIPVAHAEPITKPVSQYKTADWNQALKGKEFTDEGERYVLLNVEYQRGDNVNNYACDVDEKRYYKNGSTTAKEADRPLYILYAVLKEARKEREDRY